MNGNASAKSQTALRTIISTVQTSLGFSDTPLKAAYLQIFSVIRVLRQLDSQREEYSMKYYGRAWCTYYY